MAVDTDFINRSTQFYADAVQASLTKAQEIGKFAIQSKADRELDLSNRQADIASRTKELQDLRLKQSQPNETWGGTTAPENFTFNGQPVEEQAQQNTFQLDLANKELELKGSVNSYNSLLKQHIALEKEVAKDPMAVAVKQGLVDKLEPINYQDPEAMAQSLAQRIAVGEVIKTHYGKEVAPLTKGELTDLADRFGRSPARDQLNLIKGLQGGLAEDQANQVMQKMAKKGFDYVANSADLIMSGNEEAAELNLSGAQIRKEKGIVYDKGVYSQIAQAATDQLPNLIDDEVSASSRQAYLNTIGNVYSALAMGKGHIENATVQEDLLKEAVNKTMGGAPIKIGNNSTILPPYPGATQQDFDNYLKRVDFDRMSAKLRNGPSTSYFSGQDLHKFLNDEATWVSISPGKYLAGRIVTSRTPYGHFQPLVTDDNKPFVITVGQ